MLRIILYRKNNMLLYFFMCYFHGYQVSDGFFRNESIALDNTDKENLEIHSDMIFYTAIILIIFSKVLLETSRIHLNDLLVNIKKVL